MDNTNVIIRPLVTEKSTHQQQTRNAYAFKVHPNANKPQIKQAVEQLYNVKVVDVRTMTRKGKPRRSRFKLATTSDWKRAVVVLDENSRIELF
ncbi:MAG TPA: 50S ribosomal protein L23 [Tepidisphaeraceae bacterium]|jgi:large subunit ribosomal protein L23